MYFKERIVVSVVVFDNNKDFIEYPRDISKATSGYYNRNIEYD